MNRIGSGSGKDVEIFWTKKSLLLMFFSYYVALWRSFLWITCLGFMVSSNFRESTRRRWHISRGRKVDQRTRCRLKVHSTIEEVQARYKPLLDGTLRYEDGSGDCTTLTCGSGALVHHANRFEKHQAIPAAQDWTGGKSTLISFCCALRLWTAAWERPGWHFQRPPDIHDSPPRDI